jgi:hypothetical protein
MINPYLDKFLKKRNLYCRSSIHGGENQEETKKNSLTNIMSPIKNAPLKVINSTKQVIKTMKNKVFRTTDLEVKLKELSKKITDAIQKAFSINHQKEKLRQLELQKVSKLVIEKPINLNFGGGFLIFGDDLKISSMIHIFNKENQPFYFEKGFSSIIENNTINESWKSEEAYNVKTINEKIKNKLKNELNIIIE